LIIGIADYKYLAKLNEAYCIEDANTFEVYCKNILGIPEHNIYKLINPSSDELDKKREGTNYKKLLNIINENSEVIVYYSGHGMTSQQKEAYILPTDASISTENDNYTILDGKPIYELLTEISSKKPQKIIVYVDACFSGTNKSGNFINEKIAKTGVIRVPKQNNNLPENTIYISATTEQKPAYPYTDKKTRFVYLCSFEST